MMRLRQIKAQPFALGLLVLALGGTASAQPRGAALPEPDAAAVAKIEIQPVDLDGLSRAIAAHQGKVVLVEVWGEF